MADPNDGQVITEAWEAYVNTDPTDNIFARHALLEQLRSNGSFEKQNGRSIFHILEYATNSTVKFMSEYETLDVTAQTTFDQAEFAWKLIGGDVPMSEFERAITAAGAGKFDLMAKKIDNLKSTIEESVNTSCFSDGTGTAGKEIGGLQEIVQTTPSTGTTGAISRDSFSFWRNQQQTGTKTSTAYDNLRANLGTVYDKCSNGVGKENPTFVITSATIFAAYNNLLTANERYTRTGPGDKGISGFKGQNIMFRDIPLFYDNACTVDSAYVLNNRNLHLVYALWMKGFPAVSPTNQFLDVFKVLCILNMTSDNLRRLGVVNAIT